MYDSFLEKGTKWSISRIISVLKKTTTTKQEGKKKKRDSIYAVLFAGAAKWLQIFKIGAGAQFNSSPSKQYRCSLARTLTRWARGRVRPAALTAATGCGGETHNANTITAGITPSIKKLWKLTKTVITLGKAQNHWGAIPNKFADVMKTWSILGITVE